MKLLAKLIVLTVLSATFFVPVIHAKENKAPVNVVLEKAQIINGDYFAAGDSVHVSGTVNGDAYIAGGMVTVDGVINGDLLVAGGTVRVEGPVKNDVRALGGTVTFAGTVGGNMTIGAGTVVVSPQAKVGGSMVAGTGSLELYGPVGKGLTIGAGALTINSVIGGNVLVAAEDFTLQPKTKIAGDLTYWSQKEATFADNVALSGDTVFHEVKDDEAKASQVAKTTATGLVGALTAASAVLVILGFVAMYITGILILRLLPSFSERTVTMMKKNGWGSFGLGIVTVIVIPILAVTCMFTVVGIPVGIFLFMMTALLGFTGHIYASLFVGRSIFQGFKAERVHTAWQLLVGMAAIGIVSLIPIIGWLTKGILVLIGTGAVLFEKQNVYRQMRGKHLV
jgi:cytoskeletal protein CcmA (bactofilin family)